jgi:hypothetical protein
VRADTQPELAPYCRDHRDAVRNSRVGAGGDWGLAVRRVEALVASGVDTTNPRAVRAVYERAGLLLEGAPTTEAAPEVAVPVQSQRDETSATANLREEVAWLLSQRDAARAEVESLRDQLAAARAEAVHRPETPRPLARLTAMAKVLIPDDTIGWTVGGTRDGSGQYCAAALGDERTASWESVAATPDEALAGLVLLVEGVARAHIEALTAALEGARG